MPTTRNEKLWEKERLSASTYRITAKLIQFLVKHWSNSSFVIQNPFKTNIIINAVSNEDTYELYSIKGEKIKEGRDLSNQDFSKLAKGTYLIKLPTQNKVFKIIKE